MNQKNIIENNLSVKLLELKPESDVMETWGAAREPIVSICCITYNHVDYIEDALEGFLTQITNFPFEVLVHDDASNDGTSDILKEYENNYPNIIRTVIQKENQYSKHPIMAPRFLYPIARGNYIALCEGDDYWTAEYKLQRQVDFLEKNRKYSMYAHAINVVNEVKVKKPFYPNVKWNKTENNFLDVFNNHFIPTPSLLFRNELDDFPFGGDGSKGLTAGDMAIELFMASKGLCYYDPEEMGVYRNHDDGVTKKSTNDYKKIVGHWEHLYTTINKYTEFKYNQVITRKLSEIYMKYALIHIDNKKYKKSIVFFKKSFSYSVKVFIANLYKNIIKRINRKIKQNTSLFKK